MNHVLWSAFVSTAQRGMLVLYRFIANQRWVLVFYMILRLQGSIGGASFLINNVDGSECIF